MEKMKEIKMSEISETVDIADKTSDGLLIGYDRGDKDVAVLVVGRKRENQSVEIINAFEGENAIELYKKLIESEKNNE